MNMVAANSGVSVETEKWSRGADGQFERYAELARLLGRFNESLEDIGIPENDDRQLDPVDSEAALRLAMVAMTEAEARIARQEQRIRYLESLSVTDELTGLLNRRGFMQELSRAVAHVKRDRDAGCLIMIDLDGFKAVNDTWGHAAGDIMLTTVAEALRTSVRETDAVGRLGGDEFVVLLPATLAAEASHKAQELEQLVNGLSVTWLGSSIPVHASFGLDHFGPEDNMETVLERSDKAMYATKRDRKSCEDK